MSGVRNAEGRLASIDALRAVSILIVVTMHSGLEIVPGDGGVVVFFVISGYIITTLLIKERRRSGGFSVSRFYQRRLLKLGPPFVALILLPTLVYSIAHQVSWPAVLAQLLFSYNWAMITAPLSAASVLPGSSVVWSLAVEEQFYIVFAVIWLVFVARKWSSNGLTYVAAASIVLSLGARMYAALEADPTHALRGTDTRVEAIAWGVFAATLMSRLADGGVRWLSILGRDWVLVFAGALFVASSFLLRGPWDELAFRPTAQAVAATAALLFGVMHATTDSFVRRVYGWVVRQPIVQLIGLSSYSIYLVHYVLISALAPSFETLPFSVQFSLNFVLGVAAGIAAYRLVEVPASRLKVRIASTATRSAAT